MGSVAFSDIIQLKSLSTKCEAWKVMEMVRFSPKMDNTVDLHVRTRVPAGSKYGDEQMRLRASSSLASYRRLEKASC